MNKKEFLVLSICIFFTIIAWITADIYHEFLKSKGPSDIPPPPVIKDYQFQDFERALRILNQKTQ